MANNRTREGFEYWDRFNKLQRYSFYRGLELGVLLASLWMLGNGYRKAKYQTLLTICKP